MTERINWEGEPRRPERNVPGHSEIASHNDVVVDVNRLIALTERHPVLKVPLDQFDNWLDSECWEDDTQQRLAPRTLLNLLATMSYGEALEMYPQYASHIQRIQDADYSYPIHVYRNTPLNGAHRIARLALERLKGNTEQDFITIKELREIPKQALTNFDLLD